MPGLLEAEKKQINRPVPELAISDDTDILDVKASTETHGNGHHHKSSHRTAKSLTAMITNQQDAPSCPNCGQITVRNGACYKCLNCGESLGCS
jgi:ribonucleoside-diphosphate reductase alpha chain